MKKTNRMISLFLAVLIAAGVWSGITVYADTDTESYIAEKVTADDIADGDQIFICFEDDSVAVGTELSGSRIKPKDVTLGSSGSKSVMTDAPYTAALFTVEYTENGKFRLHADEGWLTIPSGGGMTFGDTADEFSEWEIRDGCFLYNTNYTSTSGSYTFNNYYVEYYSKYQYFTTYGKNKNSNVAIFTMSFYKLTDEAWGSRAKNVYSLPLFETSDIHGTLVDSSAEPDLHYLARISDIVKDVRSSGGSYDKSRALLLDTGDIYQGNTISNLLNGNPLRAAFDKMDYDAVSIGNHEFDWGLDVSVDRDSTMADYRLGDETYENHIPVVLSNLFVNGEKQDWLNDYVIVEKTAVNADGDTATVKIGVIGFAEDYSSSIKASAFSDLGYEIREDYDALNELAAALESSGACDATVLLSHTQAQTVANSLGAGSSIDLVLGGHKHYNKEGKTTSGIYYLQPAAYGTAYTTAQLRFNFTGDKPVFRNIADAKAVSIKTPESLLYNTEDNAENLDQDIVTLTAEALEAIQPMLNETVGKITTDALRLTYIDEETQRNCTAGNWESSIFARIVGAEVGFINKGGLRAEFKIPEGASERNITVSDIYTMFPFGEPIYRYEVTYDELLDAVEYSLTSGGKGLLSYVTGIDTYYEGKTVNALVKDGTLIYQNGEWIDGWDKKSVSIATNEYTATNNRVTDGISNPMVEWNETDKLVSDLLVDNENAVNVLREESEENGGYLYIDDKPHYILGEYSQKVLLGDANCDGYVTIGDVTAIQQMLADIPVPEFNIKAADIDGNGLTIDDAINIQKFLAKYDDPYHIGEYSNVA